MVEIMEEEEFQKLIDERKPVIMESDGSPQFGFTLIFDDGKRIYVSPDENYGQPYTSFEEEK